MALVSQGDGDYEFGFEQEGKCGTKVFIDKASFSSRVDKYANFLSDDRSVEDDEFLFVCLVLCMVELEGHQEDVLIGVERGRVSRRVIPVGGVLVSDY